MAAFVEKRQPAVKHSCAGSFPAREPGSGPPTTVDVDQAQGYKARLPRNAGHSRDNMAHHKSAKKRIIRNANRFEINHARISRIRTFVKKVDRKSTRLNSSH